MLKAVTSLLGIVVQRGDRGAMAVAALGRPGGCGNAPSGPLAEVLAPAAAPVGLGHPRWGPDRDAAKAAGDRASGEGRRSRTRYRGRAPRRQQTSLSRAAAAATALALALWPPPPRRLHRRLRRRPSVPADAPDTQAWRRRRVRAHTMERHQPVRADRSAPRHAHPAAAELGPTQGPGGRSA